MMLLLRYLHTALHTAIACKGHHECTAALDLP